ncbi:hypothetical protein [Phormidium nigroviride]
MTDIYFLLCNEVAVTVNNCDTRQRELSINTSLNCILCNSQDEGRRKKEEGRRKKEERRTILL